MRSLGVHTSIKNGILNAIEEAINLKCDTFQIFLHSPRVWQIPEFNEETIKKFNTQREFAKLNPFIIHASYLINPLSLKQRVITFSKRLLKIELMLSEKLKADYYVIHLNDNKEMEKKEIFDKLGETFQEFSFLKKCRILIENTVRGRITSKIRDLMETLKCINPQIIGGVCIDTCHLFAAGYNISEEKGISKFIEEFESPTEFELIKLIHLNDSKVSVGSGTDRHEHIGNGQIGIKGFENFLKIKELSHVPLILETPKKTPKDDLRNLNTVRKILKKLGF